MKVVAKNGSRRARAKEGESKNKQSKRP